MNHREQSRARIALVAGCYLGSMQAVNCLGGALDITLIICVRGALSCLACLALAGGLSEVAVVLRPKGGWWRTGIVGTAMGGLLAAMIAAVCAQCGVRPQGYGLSPIVYLMLVIVTPVTEEALFRGVLPWVIERHASRRVALTCAGVCFVGVHEFYQSVADCGLLMAYSIGFTVASWAGGGWLASCLAHCILLCWLVW